MTEQGFQTTSQRPYLLRAIHEWLSDNGLTPYLLVNARHPGVHVPPQAVKDGQVVLNIAEQATHMLSLGNEYITFNARFSGVSHEVFIPVGAVLAIYARETGQGMALPEDMLSESDQDDMADGDAQSIADSPTVEERKPPPRLGSVPSETDEPPPDGSPPASSPPRRGHLRVVK